MTTAPVKSQPLHNFSLPFLKWGKNPVNNQRCRRPVDPARDSPAAQHRASSSERDSESDTQKVLVGSRSARNRFSFSYCSTEKLEKQEKRQVEGVEVEDAVVKSKPGCEMVDEDAEDLVQKPWNLRPRRVVSKAVNEIGGCSRNAEVHDAVPAENQPKSMRLRGIAESERSEKKEKKFSVSLYREEIEEDIFAMSGTKAARRPKKRPKNVQKQLDTLFPGLWLAGITADSYKVSDAPAKR